MQELSAVARWPRSDRVWFSGVKLRARTSVIRLDDGSLLVHSPTPPTEAWLAQVAELGEVRWLVVPNTFHHLGTPAAAAAFPDAKIVAPAAVAAKQPALRIHADIATFTELPELAPIPLEGVAFLAETLLYHRSTKTLFGADVALWADEADHWTWRFAARVMGCYQRLRVPPDVRKKIDKVAAARTMRALSTLSIDRLVVAHGKVVETEPLERLLEAWRAVGVEV